MRAVFHIGRPKVGSTSIQKLLFENTKALARRGVFYDRVDRRYSSQWDLPIAALTECGAPLPQGYVRQLLQLETAAAQQSFTTASLRKFEASLAQRSAGKDLFVASSEHAIHFLQGPDLVAQFDTVLKRYFEEITYVIYIRDQASLATSAYSERIKRGGTMTFGDFLDNAQRHNHYDHARVLAPWIKSVTADRLKVRIMDRADLVGGDLIDDFCHCAGIDPTGLTRPVRANASLTRDAAEVMRVLNQLLPVLLKDGQQNPLRRGLPARLETLYADATPLRLTAAQQQRVQADYAAGNETMRAMFFPDRDRLFKPRRPAETTDDDSQIDHEAALQIALSMLIATRQGQIAPLNRRALHRAVSLDPLTATNTGSPPARAPFADRWPILKSPRFKQLNPLKRS